MVVGVLTFWLRLKKQKTNQLITPKFLINYDEKITKP